MPPPAPTRAPTFYLTGRQPLSPGVILLAILAAASALAAILFALSHTPRARLASSSSNSASAGPSGPHDDDKDDPNQIDTIVLGDPADAPTPAPHNHHVSPVHPTILIQLPRFGSQTGLIPDTPSGRLLYAWLAAFNQASLPALRSALPTLAPASADAQLELRRQTGGFELLSAKEAQPGVLVFRLRDQTPAATEVLGTLQLSPDSTPPTIATFSLRAVESPTPPRNSP